MVGRRRTKNAAPCVPSFFKPMYGEKFAEIMYIPPMFAPKVFELIGRNQKTFLEDSSGEQWEVSVTVVDGCLAFRQGWNDFFTGHGLVHGDFVVFHYLGTHFAVEIYNKSACQSLEFPIRAKPKKRTRVVDDNPREFTDRRSMKKHKSTEESDEQGQKSNRRNDPSSSRIRSDKEKSPQFCSRQDQSRSKRVPVETNKEKNPSLFRSRKDRPQSERHAVERDDFGENPPHCHTRKGQPQSQRHFAETEGDKENPSFFRSRKDRSQSERRHAVERDDIEENPPHCYSRKGQSQSKRDFVETDGDRESPLLRRSRKDRPQSKRHALERDDFGETPPPHCYSPKGQPQFQRDYSVETDGNRGNPSLCRSSRKDLSQLERHGVEKDYFEENSPHNPMGQPQFKREIVETDGDRINLKRQLKIEFVEDTLFGFACEAKSMHNEARRAVLDMTECEGWGGGCGSTEAAAVRNGICDRDQGTSNRDLVRTYQISNCADEVTRSVASVAVKKDKGHMLLSGPEQIQRVSAFVSGAAMPLIKKELVDTNAVPLNMEKTKPIAHDKAEAADAMANRQYPTNSVATIIAKLDKGRMLSGDHQHTKATSAPVSGAAMPLIKKEPVIAKIEPKVETNDEASEEPPRAVATNHH